MNNYLFSCYQLFITSLPIINDYLYKCVSLLKDMAYACTELEFNKHYDDLVSRSLHVKYWIDGSEMEHWCNALFEDECYENMYSNVTKSYNSWILDARHLAITKLVDLICIQITEMLS